MADVSDMGLLRSYDRQGSEEAFAALVQRHINLVYATALRHVGIAVHAEEITQVVFVILARKAASLRPDTILEGWLHETTRLTALRFRRGERRRQFREQEAYMQSTLPESADAATWNQLAPLLDEALSRLGKTDRDAVLLRFFKDKSIREVAAALRVNEEAAQKRVRRAVEKLRLFFAQRGVVHSVALLTATISTHSVPAAPAALAKAVTHMALAKGATASGSTLTLIKGASKVMAWTKAKTAIVAVSMAVILAAGTATTLIVRQPHLPKPQVVMPGQTEFPTASWVFAGYADPQSALMSFLWASTCQSDRKIFEASLAPEQEILYKRMIAMNMKVPQPHSEAKTVANTFKRANAEWQNSSYRIMDQEVVSDDQILLHLETQQPKAKMDVYVKMKKLGKEWKFDGIEKQNAIATNEPP